MLLFKKIFFLIIARHSRKFAIVARDMRFEDPIASLVAAGTAPRPEAEATRGRTSPSSRVDVPVARSGPGFAGHRAFRTLTLHRKVSNRAHHSPSQSVGLVVSAADDEFHHEI